MLGQSLMAASRTDTCLGEQYRRTARHRGKHKGIVAVSPVIYEVSWPLITDRGARFTATRPQRRTRAKIREIERQVKIG